jgi:hypothetical protein
MDSDASSGRSRLSKPARPSKEEVLALDKLPRRDFFPAAARLTLLPENRSRKAYTVVREIWLTLADSWWNKLIDSVELSLSKEELSRLIEEVGDTQERMAKIEMWLKKPTSPLSFDSAFKMIEGSNSPLWRNTILKRIGKRHRSGQPVAPPQF